LKSNARAPPELLKKYMLLDYCTKYWTYHSRNFSKADTKLWKVFKELALNKLCIFEFRPWDGYISRAWPYMSLFSWAVYQEHRPLLETLIEAPQGPGLKQYIDFHAESGPSFLVNASRSGNLSMIKFLMDFRSRDADPNITLPLVEAAENGHIEVVLFLANRTVSASLDKVLLEKAWSQETPLYALAKSNVNVEASFEHLLAYETFRGCVGQPDIHGKTPLYYAYEHGRLEVARLLLSNGASASFCTVTPNYEGVHSNFKIAALPVAVRNRHQDFIELFLPST